jgi:hypothetical protein
VNLAYKNAKNSFTIPGLGKIVLVNRKARIGRNPAIGEQIKIAANGLFGLILAVMPERELFTLRELLICERFPIGNKLLDLSRHWGQYYRAVTCC